MRLRPAPAPLNETERRRHKWRNRAQSLLLVSGMLALLSACVVLVFGVEVLPWVFVGSAAGLFLAPRASPRWVLGMYRARPLGPNDLPQVQTALAELAKRAGLPKPPVLHYVPSRLLNAFAVGTPADSAIAVTDGMLRTLSLRELVGVLAHEISHIRNNDLWVMGLADTIARLTGTLSFMGLFLLVAALPMLLSGEGGGRWLLAALLLAAAPTLGSLLQLALSRAREYDADLDAAGLTGDPQGLAAALARIERVQGRVWEMMLPGGRIPDPSLLRTHPPTEERLRRLAALLQPPAPAHGHGAQDLDLPSRLPTVARGPRWHATGAWF